MAAVKATLTSLRSVEQRTPGDHSAKDNADDGHDGRINEGHAKDSEIDGLLEEPRDVPDALGRPERELNEPDDRKDQEQDEHSEQRQRQSEACRGGQLGPPPPRPPLARHLLHGL